MVNVRFEDRVGRPLVDAIVGISRAPGEISDIGMITDAQGRLRLDVVEPGLHEFAVFHAGKTRYVSAHLAREDGEAIIVVD